MSKKKLGILILCVVLVCAAVVGFIIANGSAKADKVSAADIEKLVNQQFDQMADNKTNVVKHIADKNEIKVKAVRYGENKDIVLDCTVTTLDIHKAVDGNCNAFLAQDGKKASGMFKNRDQIKRDFTPAVLEMVKSASEMQKDIQITVYQTQNEGLKVHASDKAVNTVYGGVLDIQKELEATTHYLSPSGEKTKVSSTNIPRGLALCFEVDFSNKVPDTSTALGRFINDFKNDFKRNFIDHDRWFTIVKGLGITLALTFLSLILGLIIGFLVAFIRVTYTKNTKCGLVMRILNSISQIYLTVIRGTPVVVQVMIIYFVIFMPLGINKFLAAVVCFGLNSGAYVAEIVRGGIMSVDNGQNEAGRSLGFSYMQTMWYIIFPQAFKAILPALANEFIVLLKETSVAFYIGLGDLMYAGNAIRAATYTAFMPLVTVALIYLVMVMGFSKLVSILERRLRQNER